MNRPDLPTSTADLPEPGSDPLAALVAEVLAFDADQVVPTDRLADIRREATARRGLSRPAVAAIAAGVAGVLALGGAWAVIERPGPHHLPTGTSTPLPPPATPTAPLPIRTAPTSPSSAAVTVTLPIYYLGRDVKGLFREFQRASVPAGPGAALVPALRRALDPTSPTKPGDESPWLPGTSRAARITIDGAGTVHVDLPVAEEQSRGRTPAQATLAAQQLVWTATAAVHKPALTVRITFAGADGRLFGSLATGGRTFRRPPSSLSYQDLSAIWILAPADRGVVSGPVTVSGQACTFEANVAWQLSRSGSVVRSGRTNAAQGCPARSAWSVALGQLSPGSYTFRAYEPSPMGGPSYEGLDEVRFTVR